jgi:hypothetical protein
MITVNVMGCQAIYSYIYNWMTKKNMWDKKKEKIPYLFNPSIIHFLSNLLQPESDHCTVYIIE